MDTNRYVLSARVLHWLMAVGFIFMWGCGYYMTEIVEEDSALEELLFGLHISVGVTLLLLLVLRVIVRFINQVPPLPAELPKIEKTGSHLGHLALYLLPALIIFIGWAETDFGGHGVKWFSIQMPKVFPTMETLAGINLETFTATIHKWAAWTMFAIAIIHVAAVIKHRREGHDVLHRML